jgi:hypothetical protein
MSQRRWGRVGITINKPCHAAVACNEELVVRWLQSNPCEPREMADLKVPSLDMKHFEVIITAEDPFPTTLTIRMQLFLCGNFTANARVRVSTHIARIRLRIVANPGGGDSTTSRSRSNGGSFAHCCTMSIQPGARAACHAKKRLISGGIGPPPLIEVAANLRIAIEDLLSIFARWASIVASGSAKPPGPSYRPRTIDMFLGDRRVISPVFSDPTQTNGFRVPSDSGATKPFR